jgi:hypothetical protein
MSALDGPQSPTAPVAEQAEQKPLGSNIDAHGCVPSAGYQWCGALSKCTRPWQEPCPKAQQQVQGGTATTSTASLATTAPADSTQDLFGGEEGTTAPVDASALGYAAEGVAAGALASPAASTHTKLGAMGYAAEQAQQGAASGSAVAAANAAGDPEGARGGADAAGAAPVSLEPHSDWSQGAEARAAGVHLRMHSLRVSRSAFAPQGHCMHPPCHVRPGHAVQKEAPQHLPSTEARALEKWKVAEERLHHPHAFSEAARDGLSEAAQAVASETVAPGVSPYDTPAGDRQQVGATDQCC